MTLKTYKQQGTKHHYLEGKTSHYYSRKRQLVRVFAFTVASIDLGAHPEFLGKMIFN